MKTSASQRDNFRRALQTHTQAYKVKLGETEIARLCDYYTLLLAWNPRLHLVAPCSPTEFARRHVLESLLLLRYLERDARIADIGSGAGLPAVPCLILREDVHVTLVEASQKKSVFLREALRQTKTSERARVMAERFEDVPPLEVGYVSCRALDRFAQMFPKLFAWSPRGSTLLLFGGEELQKEIELVGREFSTVRILDSKRRFLYLVGKGN